MATKQPLTRQPLTDNPNLTLDAINHLSKRLQPEKGDRAPQLPSSQWWTGKPPHLGVCPGVNANGKISSLPLLNLETCSRQDVVDYFDNAWTLTEVLFSALQGEEAFYLPPYHQLRYPFIFYYGHTAVFYINKLRLAGIIDAPLNDYFEQLFAVGVDEMPWDDMSKNEMDWPPFHEVHAYRQQVYTTVREILTTHPGFDVLPITEDNPVWAVLMGIEHDRLHLETSSALMREFPVHLLRRPEQWLENHPSAQLATKDAVFEPQVGTDYPENQMVAMEADTVTLGKPKGWPSYGWDNVHGQRQVKVRAFQSNQYLVSNGEFYHFVKANGYSQRQYWSEEGWRWRSLRDTKWPTFWVAAGPEAAHQYKLRTSFEVVNMPWSWPAIVNYHEAKAYCAWRNEQESPSLPYRMMTEAEHHRMRDPMPGVGGDRPANEFTPAAIAQEPVMNASGHEMAASQGVNLNLAYPCEIPVDALPANSKGFHDVYGNVWQWCEDDSNPLTGFQTLDLYDDFSTPTFDGQHKMVMGCSFISTGEDASIWERFNIRPHFFQQEGFRLVQSTDGDPACDAVVLSHWAPPVTTS